VSTSRLPNRFEWNMIWIVHLVQNSFLFLFRMGHFWAWKTFEIYISSPSIHATYIVPVLSHVSSPPFNLTVDLPKSIL
jgi:hypothetical protein